VDTNDLAPPVVTVTVVHQPGAWFDEVLDGLAEQDFGNLKHLFLIVGDPGEIPQRIRSRVRNCFVRAVADNRGFGAACNEVLALVEGDNGFFCFLHDDVSLDPSAVRSMVEEVYRSNAGIVGPKLVEWDNPMVLQHVGLAVDRIGEIDPLVEPGEFDQEQHDAVRDVFAVPSACMLVRADLFRTLGGFDASMSFHGEDVDLCWRARLSGGRVLVVPAARGRHIEGLVERRPDIAHERLRAQHRVRSVLSLTGARRLPFRVVRLIGFTIAEFLVGFLTGSGRRGWEALRAVATSPVRAPALIARRRAVASLRRVPDGEVAAMQLGGSARLASYMRSRDNRVLDPDVVVDRRWRQTAGALPAIAWVAIVLASLIGGRHLIRSGVPSFGEFLRYPASPRGMLVDYWSGWSGVGDGAGGAAPTGVALLALGSVSTLFQMDLWRTVAVLGASVLGAIGMWRMATIFGSARARVCAVVVYLLAPLASGLLGAGRWSGLAVMATLPWVLHYLRRFVGIDTRGAAAEGDDHVVDVSIRKRVRFAARVVLVTSMGTAFVPSIVVIVLIMAALMAVATVVSGGRWRIAGWWVLGGMMATIGALLLNAPWTLSLFNGGIARSLRPAPVGPDGLSVVDLLTFDVAGLPLTVLATGLYISVIVAPLIVRQWRFTWAVRAAVMVIGFAAISVLVERDLLATRLSDPAYLTVPLLIGIALSVGCIVEAFERDVLGQSFGFRQPLAIVALAGALVGLVPGLVAHSTGRWSMPELTLQSALRQLPGDTPIVGDDGSVISTGGDYRVLWVGDPRLIPVGSWEYRPGIAYALTDDGPIEVAEAWAPAPSPAAEDIAEALGSLAGYDTLRVGRLLAPFGIRYVIVPLVDESTSTIDRPLPVSDGLRNALDAQLDLAAPLAPPPNYRVYVNEAWVPSVATLTEAGTAASREAGIGALVRADLRGAQPVLTGDSINGATFPVAAGTLQVAVPFDERWELIVDGRAIEPRPSFGTTTAFEVPTAGDGTLRYRTPLGHRLAVVAQVSLWLVAAFCASRLTLRRPRRPAEIVTPAPLPELDLTTPVMLPAEVSTVERDDSVEVDPPSDVGVGVLAESVDDLAEALGTVDAHAGSGDAGERPADVDLSDDRPAADGHPEIDDGIRWKDST
jgi:GT2 family glycosyltransferase